MKRAAGFYGGAQNVAITTPDPKYHHPLYNRWKYAHHSSPTYSSPIKFTTQHSSCSCIQQHTCILQVLLRAIRIFINVTHTLPVVSIFGDQIRKFAQWKSI